MGGLFGGSAPKAPDPYKTADAQLGANLETARLTAMLNRANQYTPFGSQTWSQGGNWDEAGYNAALAAWQQGGMQQASTPAERQLVGYSRVYDGTGSDGDVGRDVPMYSDGSFGSDKGLTIGPTGMATTSGGLGGSSTSGMPSREDFGYNPDLWESTISLDPRLQELLDSNIALQQGMTGAQQGALSNVNQLFSSSLQSPAQYRADAAAQVGPGPSINLNMNNPGREISMYKGLVQNSGRLTNEQINRLRELYATDFNYDHLGAMPTADQETRQRVEDALYARMAGRLDPLYGQREADLTSRLAAQGITQGSQAYGDEFGILGRDRNDAYSNAINDSILMGGDEMQRQFAMEMAARQQGVGEANYMRELPTNEALAAMGLLSGTTSGYNSLMQTQMQQEALRAQTALAQEGLRLQGLGLGQQLAQGAYGMDLQSRNQALNELSSLMSGTQVQLPQFGSTASGAQVGQVPIGQYMQDNYNAQVGAYNSQQQGIAGLGSAFLGAAGSAGGFGKLFEGI